jgi:DNA polymerase III subunit epsilon
MTWTAHVGDMTPVDLETTGTDVWADRIVTAAVVTIRHRTTPQVRTWLINPGVDIPAEAVAVHGITTEQARAGGVPPVDALTEIAETLHDTPIGVPIVAFNAAFDLTMLAQERARYGVSPMAGGYPVIDPYVVDKAVDRYRPGKRTLGDLCALYNVTLDDAHDAAADALAAARLVWRFAQLAQADHQALCGRYRDRRYPEQVADAWKALGAMTLPELHDAQVGWAHGQAESFAGYLRKQADQLRYEATLPGGDEQARQNNLAEAAELDARAATVLGGWPIRTREGAPDA